MKPNADFPEEDGVSTDSYWDLMMGNCLSAHQQGGVFNPPAVHNPAHSSHTFVSEG